MDGSPAIGRVAEIVIAVERRIMMVRFGGRRAFDVCRNSPVHAQYGHAVRIEMHRHEHGCPAQCPAVLEHERVPLAIGRVHHATLRHTLVMVSQVVIQNAAAPELTVKRIRDETILGFAVATGEMTGEQVIPPIMPLQMGSLVSQILIRQILHEHTVESTGLRSGQIRIHLGQPQCGVAVNDEHTPIVKEQRRIVVEAPDDMMPPWAAGVPGGEQMGCMGVVRGEQHMEPAVVPSQGRRPHSLPIQVLIVVQHIGARVPKCAVDMAIWFPVRQVERPQYVASGHEMHRGARHVIGMADPDDVGIGKVRVEYWILDDAHETPWNRNRQYGMPGGGHNVRMVHTTRPGWNQPRACT